MSSRAFPEGFLWGVATSAQQIEGGASEGGRGESIWDRFAATPGRIADGSNPLVACDHFHRWRQDVELMRWLGVGAYRFSIAWPRVAPQGYGKINLTGLEFYDALVDALLDAGIQPFVTLYHWDLPQALQEQGGWSARSTCELFAEYASVVAEHLGDRVRYWITHNEPWCVATLGHESGEHAPGHRNPTEALRVAHHLLLSHGWAAEAIRQKAGTAEVGIALILSPATPFSSDEADREAARQFDGAFNRWYLDPLFLGCYPADAVSDRVRWGHLAGEDLPFVREGDLRAISAPLDFIGLNYYSRTVLKLGPDGKPAAVSMAPREQLTEMGWEVYPEGLHDILIRLTRDYGPRQIYITENGMACPDIPDGSGRIADSRRRVFLRDHMIAAHRAIADGVPLRGYFIWSLLDNFEWAHGYTKRFGLYAVDSVTQLRRPKDSAFWCRDIIAANAVGGSTPEMP